MVHISVRNPTFCHLGNQRSEALALKVAFFAHQLFDIKTVVNVSSHHLLMDVCHSLHDDQQPTQSRDRIV